MTTLTQLFTNIAGAIRSKTGGNSLIKAENFPAEIAAIATGTDTSDATATAADIEEGKTAYVNGQKVIGNLLSRTYFGTNGNVDLSRDEVFIECHTDFNKMIMPPYSRIRVYASLSNFGDATAADVAAGKTFTSAAGLLVAGTAAAGGSVTMGEVTVSNILGNIAVTGLNLPTEPQGISVWFFPSSVTHLSNINLYDTATYTILNFTIINGGVYICAMRNPSDSNLKASFCRLTWNIDEFTTDYYGKNVSFSMSKDGFTLSSKSSNNIRFIQGKYNYMIW